MIQLSCVKSAWAPLKQKGGSQTTSLACFCSRLLAKSIWKFVPLDAPAQMTPEIPLKNVHVNEDNTHQVSSPYKSFNWYELSDPWMISDDPRNTSEKQKLPWNGDYPTKFQIHTWYECDFRCIGEWDCQNKWNTDKNSAMDVLKTMSINQSINQTTINQPCPNCKADQSHIWALQG